MLTCKSYLIERAFPWVLPQSIVKLMCSIWTHPRCLLVKWTICRAAQVFKGRVCQWSRWKDEWKSALSFPPFKPSERKNFKPSQKRNLWSEVTLEQGSSWDWTTSPAVQASPGWYLLHDRCGHCEAMFEEVASLEAHIDVCAGNQVCFSMLAFLWIVFLRSRL